MINDILLVFIVIMELYLSYQIINKTYQYYQQAHYHLKNCFNYLIKYYLNIKTNHLLFSIIAFSFFKHFIFKILIISLLIILYLRKRQIKDIIPLKYTKRIKRLLTINIIFIVSLFLLSNYLSFNLLINLIFFLLPVISLISFIFTIPIEKLIQNKYLRKAQKTIKRNNIEIIAITGSFGKTTTKNFIYEVIKNDYITTISPSSYNTLNGLALTINNLELPKEKLILEYGASHKNDIKKLVSFIKPNIAIVTGIGEMHLATFKTLDNIVNEKMSLINSLEENDLGIINIDDENISSFNLKNKARIIKVGCCENADYRAYDIVYNENGLYFKIKTKEKNFNIETSLLGRHNIYNILITVALSDYLKIPQNTIEREVSQLTNVTHRLELLHENNYIIIDDSFNSNYQGFINALEVLSFYTTSKILITPGIVEERDKAKEINEKVASEIIKICDYVYLVTSESSQHLKEYFKKEGYNQYEEVYSTKEAIKKLVNKIPRGVILIENDISDYYKI